MLLKYEVYTDTCRGRVYDPNRKMNKFEDCINAGKELAKKHNQTSFTIRDWDRRIDYMYEADGNRVCGMTF